MHCILIIEDDVNLCQMIKDWLKKDRFHVETCHQGEEGIDRALYQPFDAVILDWELPDIPGVEVLKRLREKGCKTPILMLTGKSDLPDKSLAFEYGVDDYLTKPDQIKEVGMRLKAVLRRPKDIEEPVIKIGKLTLEPESQSARIDATELKIMPKEFALLCVLARHPDHLFSREALLERLWMDNEEASSEALRASVKRLRNTLKECDVTIKTVYGQGYKLVLIDS